MAWDSSNQGGFTDSDAEPWLPLSAEAQITNTADQTEDPASLLNWYKTLLKFRKSSSALQSGELRLLPRDLSQKGLLGYTRETDEEKLLVLINMSPDLIQVDFIGAEVILQTGYISPSADKVKLGGLSGAVLKAYKGQSAAT
jgi:glycosidase